MVDPQRPDSQQITIAEHRLVDILDPVTAMAIADLSPPARHMAKPGGKIRLMAALKHHLPLVVAVAIKDRETFDRVVPFETPTFALWHR